MNKEISTLFNLKKKVDSKDKNKITRDLRSSVIEEVNGNQTIKHELARKKQIDLAPLCIIYDPKYSEDENKSVPCIF